MAQKQNLDLKSDIYFKTNGVIYYLLIINQLIQFNEIFTQ